MKRIAASAFVFAVAMGACIADFEGVCRLGTSDCDGACVELAHDTGNCGSCGVACAEGEMCVGGACQRPCGALAGCDGACVDPSSDPRHCGSCGNACAVGEVCDRGACASACAGASKDCQGSCVDIASDEANCGDCGVVCPADQSCIDGGCGCHATVSDDANCGACGNVCRVGQRCFDGSCLPVCHGVRCATGDAVFAMRLGQAGNVIPTSQRDQLSYAVDFDREGYAIFAADARGALSFGGVALPSSNGILLARIDLAGRVDFAQLFGTPGTASARAIIATDDGGYILAGSYNGSGTSVCTLPASLVTDGFVVKLAADRSCVWGVNVSSAGNDEIRHIALTPDGGVALTGWVNGPATLTDANGVGATLDHSGDDDVVVGMIHSDGLVRWADTYGGALRDRAYAITQDSAGNPIVTGEYRGAMPYATGDLPASVADQDALLALKLGARSGTPLWGNGYPIDSTQTAHNAQGVGIACDAEDRVWLFGDFQGRIALGNGDTVSSEVGSRDLVLLALDGDGALLTHQRWGDERNDEAGDILIGDGVLELSGAFEQTIDFGTGALGSEGPRNVFFATLSVADDLALTALSSRSFGGAGNAHPRRMAQYQGATLLVGDFLEEVDLGFGPLWSPIGEVMLLPNPENDAFIVAISH